jgi:16S rRNA (uracil1498-N3)-methyltransferase
MPRFLIEKETAPSSPVSISGQDAKHICKVLRLKSGGCLELTNGKGLDFEARITFVSPRRVDLEIIRSFPSVSESDARITVCTGMIKDKKMDMVIRQLTELGITGWMPFFCERSIPTPNAKRIQNRIQRWEAIVKESIKQCQRSRLPSITRPVSFETVLQLSDSFDMKIAFWEKSARKIKELSKQNLPEKSRIMILIGPEGGFSESEIDQAEQKGFKAYSLGPRILRAETAAISAGALVQHIIGDI